MKLEILPEFRNCVDNYRALVISADVVNSPSSEEQINEINNLADHIAATIPIDRINKIPAIASTRMAYKACGKDPNRYRPSQEQLMRRIVRGLGLYNVNAIVDAGNQFSLITGCSVGCFDADKLAGDTLYLGVGQHDEPYEGIGRGQLNIEGLPVFRDAVGGIGTPTSDNERTKIELDTKRLLVTVHLFTPELDADEVLDTFTNLFTRFANATNIKAEVHSL